MTPYQKVKDKIYEFFRAKWPGLTIIDISDYFKVEKHCFKITITAGWLQPLTFRDLMDISEFFGTSNFEFWGDKNIETFAISDITWDTETTQEYNFVVLSQELKLKDLVYDN